MTLLDSMPLQVHYIQLSLRHFDKTCDSYDASLCLLSNLTCILRMLTVVFIRPFRFTYHIILQCTLIEKVSAVILRQVERLFTCGVFDSFMHKLEKKTPSEESTIERSMEPKMGAEPDRHIYRSVCVPKAIVLQHAHKIVAKAMVLKCQTTRQKAAVIKLRIH